MMKISIALVAVLSLAAVGCKKGGGGNGADCAASIGKGIDQMAAARGGKDLPPDVKAKMDDFMGKMKAIVVQRCTEDAWPADVVKCFDTVASRPDMMKCQGMLPQDQQEKVRGQVRDLMVGPNGLGHMGHGHRGSGEGGSDSGDSGSAAPAPAPAAGSGSAAPAAGSGSSAPAAGSGK